MVNSERILIFINFFFLSFSFDDLSVIEGVWETKRTFRRKYDNGNCVTGKRLCGNIDWLGKQEVNMKSVKTIEQKIFLSGLGRGLTRCFQGRVH